MHECHFMHICKQYECAQGPYMLFFALFLQANCSTNSPNSGTSPSARSRKPGAIIESFVNHAPGVFSGTFSGEKTLSCY